MEKTQKYTLKDFFKNIGSALYHAFIANNDVLDADYVQLTGDLAKDPEEALENFQNSVKTQTRDKASIEALKESPDSVKPQNKDKVHKPQSPEQETEQERT